MKPAAFVLFGFGIILSEIVLNFSEIAGFALYIVLVGLALVSMENDIYITKSEKLLAFMMVIPIARISEFFLDFGFFWKTLIFYLILAFLAVYYIGRFKLDAEYNIGSIVYPIALLIAGVLGAIGAKYFLGFQQPEIVFLIPLMAYSEEILFRGAIQNLTKDCYTVVHSIVFPSLLYTIFSLSFGFPIVLIALLVSVIISFVYFYTKSLLMPFIINLLFNAALIFYIILA
jgi:membrane protease YdiL (CAAX protease family)